MATLDFTTYSELQSSALSFCERPAETTEVKGWIRLAEVRLNRRLPVVEVDATLTATAGSRDLSVSSLSISQPVALKLVDGNEKDLLLKPLGTILFIEDQGEPTQWSYDSDDAKIVFDRPSDSAYSLRFVYRELFALSDSATTNWLLTNHPDLYLAATLIWGASYREDIQNAVAWKTVLEEGISEVRKVIAAGKVGQLTHDPALVFGQPRRGTYQGVSS